MSSVSIGGNWKSFLKLATGDGIASWPLAGWIMALGVFDAVLSGYSENDIDPAKLAVAVFLSSVAMFALIWVCWYLCLRHLEGRARVAATLATYVGSAVLRYCVLDLLIRTALEGEGALAYYSNFAWRGVAYTALMTAALAIGAYVVGISRANRSKVGQLRTEYARVQLAVESVNESIAHDHSIRNSEVQRSLDLELSRLREADPEQTIGETERIIAQVVRPLSRELAQDIPSVDMPTVDPEQYQVSWKSLWEKEHIVIQFEPLLTTVVFSLYICTSFTMIFDFADMLAIFAMVPLMLLGLFIVKIVVRKYLGFTNWLLSLIVVSLLIVVALLPATVVFYLLTSQDDELGPSRVFLVTGVVITWLVTLASTHLNGVNKTSQQLDAVEAELTWVLARAHMEQWHEAGRTARILHGPVQAELLAYLRALYRQKEQGTADSGELERRRSDLIHSLSSNFSPSDAVESISLSGFDRLADTRALWKGIAEIEVDLDESTMLVLSQDAVASEILLSVVEESISNAIKHGSATKVDLVVHLDTDKTVSLVLIDNGRSDSSLRKEGVGTKQLNDCALTWDRASGLNGTTLSATLPVDRHVS
ncbi:MAG: hypothetical protein WAS05_08685 [Candidatus Nanopelagicales bacterium]